MTKWRPIRGSLLYILIITDDQFKDTRLSLIISKHSIRNLVEKMDLLIEKSSKSSVNSNINDDIFLIFFFLLK